MFQEITEKIIAQEIQEQVIGLITQLQDTYRCRVIIDDNEGYAVVIFDESGRRYVV